MDRGFTVLEMLLALSIALALLALGLPAAQPLQATSRAAASSNEIIGAVAFARAAALFKQQPITLCPAESGTATQACGERDHWHQGSLIFVDADRDGELDGGEQVLRQFSGWRHGGRVTWRAFGAKRYLRFNPRGLTDWQNGSFVYCPGSGELKYARRIVLNVAGRTYRAPDTDQDGIDDAAGGGPVQCP